MTRQELQQQYDLHDISGQHNPETCEICQKMEHINDNPLRNIYGDNY